MQGRQGCHEPHAEDRTGEHAGIYSHAAQPTLASEPRHKTALFSLETLDPGSGRKHPAKWHGAGAYPGDFYPINLVLRMGNFVLRFSDSEIAVLRLAWYTVRTLESLIISEKHAENIVRLAVKYPIL